ncbi:DUF418 domain-containing protein [Povalibacter sp.]|uniref:DUF418 domain-containing protein n=1 Tax=Povalibacter sp. TaxID=1962978 RepID=UPI002F3F7F69
MQDTARKPERIEVVDALRGYALMGLFLIHMVEYYELYWADPFPNAVNSTMFFLFGGKSYAMFALLFGVSFFIIMDSQARKGVDFRARFLWRLTILFALGFAHSLIYGGDIMQVLALTGLLLVPLYGASNVVLIGLGAFFILQGPALILNAAGFQRQGDPTLHPLLMNAYAHGSLLEVFSVNTWAGQVGKWGFMFDSGRLWNIIGFSQLGFALGRIGFFTQSDRFKSLYVRSIVILVIVAGAMLWFGHRLAPVLSGRVVESCTNNSLMLATLLGLLLLYRVPAGAKVLRPLAPCGRMTLTIYITQSLFLVPVFYGFGLGAYAWLGQGGSAALGIALWVLQMWLARRWFRNFYYGPLEWLWRSATFLDKTIPFKRRNDATPQVVSA